MTIHQFGMNADIFKNKKRGISGILFAGGGGTSQAYKKALSLEPDFAINHSATAIAMHRANHPNTKHYQTDIWSVDPNTVMPDRWMYFLWASPDCKHFSRAKGGALLDRNIRDLAWVVVDWAEKRRPKVIMLENVPEFTTWGPLDNSGKPIKEFAGQTFDLFISRLNAVGYKVEWKIQKCCNFADPTIRERLVIIARCDGKKIIWPKQSHAPLKSPSVMRGRLQPYKSVASIIDWTLPCPSIFETREEIKAKHGVKANRPLSENTHIRIFKGLMKYVINAGEPYIVSYAQHGGGNKSIYDPMHTITASRKDQNLLIMPQYTHAEKVAGFIAQHNGGVIGRSFEEPLSTITQRGTQQAVVAAYMLNLKGSNRQAYSASRPVASLCAQGGHAALVAAFMMKYYGTGIGSDVREPLHTVTTNDRHSLVTVKLSGEDYIITDIGMRMLTAREQFRAHSFPDDYIIDPQFNGKPLAKTKQTENVGNSVPVNTAAAHIKANCDASELMMEAC